MSIAILNPTAHSSALAHLFPDKIEVSPIHNEPRDSFCSAGLKFFFLLTFLHAPCQPTFSGDGDSYFWWCSLQSPLFV
jgi:hypothetical protein